MSAPAPRQASPWIAAGVTLAAVGLMSLGLRTTLPVIDGEGLAAVLSRGGLAGLFNATDHSAMSVLALGLQPAITAFVLVELLALAVPALRGMRHTPAGRARLGRYAAILGLVFAVVQAFGVATTLDAMAERDALSGALSIVRASGPKLYVLTITTLVGGYAVLTYVAGLVTRFGLGNGFVVLSAFAIAREMLFGLGQGYARSLGGPIATQLQPIAGLAVACAACVVALRARISPAPSAASTAYRDRASLAMPPSLPIPASSASPVVAAASILMAPAAFANFHVPLAADLQRVLERGGAAFTVAYFAVTLALAGVLSALFNDPGRVAAVASQLGVSGEAASVAAARAALRSAVAHTLLFFVGLLIAGAAGGVGVAGIPLLVAACVDVVRRWAVRARERDGVIVWEERRAYAVPTIVAALGAQGIRAHVQGIAPLTMLQIFGPYACAEIVVPSAHAERARALLGHWLAGEAAPDKQDAPQELAAAEAVAPSRGGLAVRLGVIVALGALVAIPSVFARLAPRAPAYDGPRAKLEIVHVDDDDDPLADVRDEALPVGVEIFTEAVPAGPGRTKNVHFARIRPRDGESPDAAISRVRPWLASLAVPSGTRFGFEDLVEVDEAGEARITGARTFLLTGEPLLTEADVKDAAAVRDGTNGSGAYVALEFTEDGGRRFADATGAWIRKRMAIVVDGKISSAPVIQTRIAGGRASITMGVGAADVQWVEACALAQRLRGRAR